MSWNIAPECTSTVVLCIIWIYSRKGNPSPSLKNRLFQGCFFVTFCAMTSNILSTLLLYQLTPATLVPAWLVTSFYFIATPLMGMIYYFYVLTYIYDEEKTVIKRFLITSVPGFAYMIMVLLNPFTKSLFAISLGTGYTKGHGIAATYVVFYLYCLACAFAVLIRRRAVQSSIRTILFVFPFIAAGIIIVQMIFPDIILSGSAATSALLLIYLFLQNKQISIDYLTGIPNRQEFLKTLELKLNNRSDTPFTIIVLSLKNFKVVNDTYGQLNGDAFLVAVSDYLKKNVSLGKGNLYRYSGDQFALLLDQPSDENIKKKVVQIQERMTQLWQAGPLTSVLQGVLGIVRYPQSAEQTAGLINGIEYAVSLAKKNHEGVCYCDAEILEQVTRRIQIASILEERFAQDQFEMYYQPIYQVETGGFPVAEALMRMNNTPLGNLSPGEFIPVAEECGLIIDVTYKVLDRVCKQILALERAGIEVDGIGVNYSSLQFTQRDLIAKTRAIIEQNAVPFSKIKFEITESTLAENEEAVAAFIYEMQALGCRIGLDDFGTGFSNLTSVMRLSLDTIKLDKSLVWSSLQHERSEKIVRSMTRAFNQLGMTVLAEGVETTEQSQFVEECGCKYIQGFLYARPMPAADYLAFLKEKALETNKI